MKEKNATSSYIKEIMEEHGLKTKDLAEKIGYSRTMLSYMLNDQRSIKDTDVIRIAEVLGVTPNELFGISSAVKMPIEITIKAEPEKIAGLVSEIQNRQHRTDRISKTAFEVIRKFAEDFGIDDIEISGLINGLKNDFFNE